MVRQRKSEVAELRHTTAATTCFHISNWIHRLTDPTSTATTLCKQHNEHTTDNVKGYVRDTCLCRIGHKHASRTYPVNAVTCPECLALLRGTGEELATLAEE